MATIVPSGTRAMNPFSTFSVTSDPHVIARSRNSILRCLCGLCVLNSIGVLLVHTRDSQILLAGSAGVFLIGALILWRQIVVARSTGRVELFKG